MSEIYDLAERYVVEHCALDPLAASRAGIPGHETELTDYSPDGSAARIALDRKTLARVQAAGVENERDRVARDVMVERLENAIALVEGGEPYLALRTIGSPVGAFRQVFDGMPKTTTEEWRDIVRRLEKVPEALARFRVTLDEGFEKGIVNSQRMAAETALQCETWSGQTGPAPFFDTLVDAYDRSGVDSGALRGELSRAAQAATDAYSAMGVYCREVAVPRGVARDGCGRERYSLSARSFLGADIDIDETYAWGWAELHRLEAEMAATAGRILPGASVEAAVEDLDSDEANFIEGVEPYRRWLQDEHDRALRELDGRHFAIDPRGMRIEVMIPPPGGALAAYYSGPSEDFSRPGRTWWPTGTATRFARWRFISTAYHEGVPGHHLDYVSRRSLEGELSRYQRSMAFISGYSEGWALYAERLMGELGYLEIPEYYLGMLKGQAMRAARVIVDIGMHLGLAIPVNEPFHPGERWTPELAVELLVAATSNSREFMESEVVRYLGWPGQAISYKVGERYWLEAREAARRRMGEAFDLKAFHSDALGLGPMGLEQLQRELG